MTEPSATIVHKLPKQIVPDDYLRQVIAENKAGFGFAGQENGKKIVIENTKAILLNEVNELQYLFKDNHLVMYFTNGGTVPDDVMPYAVSNGKTDGDCVHHMAIFYEGGFEKYAGLDVEHSGVYNVYDAEIMAKIGNVFIENGKDWAKTFEAMRGEKFQRILCNYFANRGAYVILPPTGDPICFGTNDIGGQFPWGNVSNRHGYTGKPAEAPVEESGLSFLRGKLKSAMSSAASVVPVTPPAIPEPIPEVPLPSEGHPDTQVTRKAGEDIETQVVDGVTYTKMRPPSAIRGNKKANNAWLRLFNHGKLDAETQSRQWCWVATDLMPYAQRIVKSRDEVEKMEGEIHRLKKAPPAVTKADRVAEESRNHLVGADKPITGSTVRESVAVAAEKNAAAKSVADHLPILSDEQRENKMTKMAAFTSKGKRLTGIEIQKMEATWPTFSEDIGVKFEEMMERPVDEIVELFDGNKVAACAFIEMRAEVNRLRTLAAAAKLDITKPTKAEKAAVPPASKPEDKKADSGGLSFLRGKSAA